VAHAGWYNATSNGGNSSPAGDLLKESDDVQNVRLQGQEEETETQEVAEIESFSSENARPRAFLFFGFGRLDFAARPGEQ
jgi:hypothetical protein